MHSHGKLLLPLLAAAAIAACDGGTGSETTRVSIRMTDAAGDLDEAWVKVDRIYLMGGPADSTGGRVDLLTTPTGWVNLLTLSGGRTAELVNGTLVPAGTYSELRMVVCEAYVVTDEGDVYATNDADLPAGGTADGTLHVPSGCSSGFKVKFPADARPDLEGASNLLTVDFDVSQSFGHQAGNSGRWVMHPVLHATAVSFAGSIAGTVALATGVAMPACGGGATAITSFVPRAVLGADSLSSTVQADGTYRITAAPGTYTMSYVPDVTFTNGDSLTFTATPSAATAVVAQGATQTVNYSVSAATCH